MREKKTFENLRHLCLYLYYIIYMRNGGGFVDVQRVASVYLACYSLLFRERVRYRSCGRAALFVGHVGHRISNGCTV